MTEMMPISASCEGHEIALLKRRLHREKKVRAEAERHALASLQRLGEIERRLRLLHRVAQQANSIDTFDDALLMAARELVESAGWQVAIAYKVGRSHTSPMRCLGSFSDIQSRFDAFLTASKAMTNPADDRILHDATLVAEPMWMEDLRTELHFKRRRHARISGLRCGCIVPVVNNGRTFALLEVYSDRSQEKQDQTLSTLQQVASQLATVQDREEARELLIHEAHHDHLTGLANRNSLHQRISEIAAFGGTEIAEITAITIDLDEFKIINDRFGHAMGDTVLASVAHRLMEEVEAWREASAKAGVYANAVLSRAGGDEFVLLQRTSGGSAPPDMLAKRLLGALRQPLTIGLHTFSIRASLGIASCKSGARDTEALIQDADLAMYDAKSSGGDCIVAFNAELGDRLRKRRLLEEELNAAFLNGQFILEYQPIVALDEQLHVRGYEALIRWNHPTRGLLYPADFIDVAGEAGLIGKIGDWVIREACSASSRAALKLEGPPPFISVNVAPQQLLDENFPDYLAQVLEESGAKPESIKLEITESVAISNPQSTKEMLIKLRAMGIKVALDDFGTGHSSLSYLRTFAFDALKIDKSFIDQISDPKSCSIVETIMRLAGTLELRVIAEGIEEKHQVEALRAIGCDLGQGYLFGRSMPESLAFA